MIQKSAILTLLFITFLFAGISVCQVIEDKKDDIIIESLNDSVDLVNNFYEYEDSLSYLFSSDTMNVDINDIISENPSDSIYGSWDTENTHYPKNDFSNKTDTTVIVLADKENHFFCQPFKGPLSSHFGPRRWRYHYGTDIALNRGDTVRCAFDGKVRIRKRSRTYGYVVVVRHFNGLESLYAHLSKAIVDSNQVIRAGDVVGLGGNTGRSRGPHLHFELRYLGAPINSEDIINYQTDKLISDTLLLSKKNFQYLEEIKKLKAAKYHKIRSGDSLSRIAVRYHTNVTRLCRLNGISKKTILRPGRRIRVR